MIFHLNNVSLITHFQFNIIHFENRNPGRKSNSLSHYFTSGVKKRSSKRGRTFFLLVPKGMLKPELMFPQSYDFSSQQCFPNHSLSVQHHSFQAQESRPEIQIAKLLFHLRGEKAISEKGTDYLFTLFIANVKTLTPVSSVNDSSSHHCFLNHSLSVQHLSFRKQESRQEIQFANSLFHLRGEKAISENGTNYLFPPSMTNIQNPNICFHKHETIRQHRFPKSTLSAHHHKCDSSNSQVQPHSNTP